MISAGQIFAVHYRPYRFRLTREPHGLIYCLRIADPAQAAAAIKAGRPYGNCIQHGIVFGGWENIAAELDEPYNEWALAGALPFLISEKEIPHLGACHLPERKPLDRWDRYRWLIHRKFRNPLDRRIWEARRAAHERKMKGLSHA